MTLRSPIWRGRLPRAVLLVLATSLVPAMSLAAERPTPRVSALKAAVANVPATPAVTTPRLRSATRAAQNQSGQTASFFRTRSGILALAVMVAGAGYAVYSTQNDRIKSPGAK